MLSGLSDVAPLLVTAIPLGVYNFTEGMNNVESAAAAGDRYDLRAVLLADGLGAVVGAFLGSPFPPAVYIGHPGWKGVGARIGYSMATGFVIAAVCLLGLVSLLLALIPIQALVPILLFIGLAIGAQAFQATPARHAPAVVLAMLPNVAAWGRSLVDGALGASGTSAEDVGFGSLNDGGVVYQGMELLGSGAVLAGLILGAIAVFVIDRAFDRAIVSALIGAGLSVLGLIHAPHLIYHERGAEWLLEIPGPVFLGYLFAAVVFGVLAWRAGRGTIGEMATLRTTPAESDAEPSPA